MIFFVLLFAPLLVPLFAIYGIVVFVLDCIKVVRDELAVAQRRG